MSIVEQIKNDRIRAMKARNEHEKSLLTVLLGDIENKSTGGKSLSDAEVVAMVKKYITNAEENKAYHPSNDLYDLEISILNQYLPQQLTQQEIESILHKAIKTGQVSHIGEAMKFLKIHYEGQYDGKIASERARYLLTRV